MNIKKSSIIKIKWLKEVQNCYLHSICLYAMFFFLFTLNGLGMFPKAFLIFQNLCPKTNFWGIFL